VSGELWDGVTRPLKRPEQLYVVCSSITHWIHGTCLCANRANRKSLSGRWWLKPVILATQEVEIRRITVRSQPRQIVLQDPISKKSFTKIELVKWLKVKALSSSPSPAKKKKKRISQRSLVPKTNS
jgi:hypothetical protein